MLAQSFPSELTHQNSISFFSQYSRLLEWDKCVLCEAIVAGDRADPADGVDNLFAYALYSGMPIKVLHRTDFYGVDRISFSSVR